MKINELYEGRGINCGRIVSQYESKCWPSRGLDRWNLLLISRGSCVIETEYGCFTASEGDMILCGPTAKRIFSITDKVDWNTLWFHLDLHVSLLWKEPQKKLFLFRPEARLFRRLWRDAQEIYSLALLRQGDWYPLANNLLEHIILRGNLLTHSQNVDPKMKVCAIYLAEQLKMPDISVLTNMAGMCRTKFFAAFRRSYGTTPRIYFETLKLNRVCNMAATTDLSFSEIAECCGFPNLFYLSKRFKKVYQLSLSEYRRKRRD